MVFSIQQQVKIERLSLLFDHSVPAVFISVLNALILGLVLWQPLGAYAVSLWWLAIMVAFVSRCALFYAYRKASPSGDDVLDWERPYFLSLLLSAAVWGLGALVMLMLLPLTYQLIVAYFLIGMAGGALSLYSSIRYFSIYTMLVVLVPMIAWFALDGGPIQWGAALGGSIFVFSGLKGSKVLSKKLNDSFYLNQQLIVAKEVAEKLAMTDMLTNLNNRRSFLEKANLQYQQCMRQCQSVAVLLIDADDFKKINDTWGHAVGDAALIHIARVLTEHLRAADVCGRIGGEEFVVFLPDANIGQAKLVAEKIRSVIELTQVASVTPALYLTVSIGIAVTDTPQDLEDLFKQADAAMYEVKQNGKNNVATFAAH